MSKAGLFDGDYVILRKAEAPVDGAIMLCRYKEQPIIKRVRIEAGKAYLCWEDDSRKRLEADPASCEVLGILEWVYKTAGR